MVARSLLLGQCSPRAIRAFPCTTPAPQPDFARLPRNCPECRTAAFPTSILTSFSIGLCAPATASFCFPIILNPMVDVQSGNRTSGQASDFICTVSVDQALQ